MIYEIPLDNFLVIDIETVSCQKNFESLSPEWQQLWADKVSRILPADISADEFYLQRAAVMAEFSKIVCISLGYFKKENGNYNLRVKSLFNHDENAMLVSFLDMLIQLQASNKHWNFTGHNIKEFDIPFICRRLLINGLQLPACLNFQNKKPWETNLVDTFQYWRFGDYKNFTSLNLLATALNIPSPKDDIDGSMVGNVYWKENDLERIANYCQKDVVTVANIILRLKSLPILSKDQIILVS